jgi:PAS domain S-box-containing protein
MDPAFRDAVHALLREALRAGGLACGRVLLTGWPGGSAFCGSPDGPLPDSEDHDTAEALAIAHTATIALTGLPYVSEALGLPPLHTIIAVPVLHADRAIGAVSGASTGDADAGAVAALEDLARLVGAQLPACDAGGPPMPSHARDALRTLFTHAPSPMVVFDDQGIILDANEASRRLFGARGAMLIGRLLPALLGLGSLPEAGETVIGRIPQDDGCMITVGVSSADIVTHGGCIVRLAALSDQSVSLNLADERIRMAELAGVLRTIATVNHQINNPLFGMVATVQLMRNELEPVMSASLLKKLDRMAECCDRIKDITDQLGQVVRPTRQTYIAQEDMLDLARAVEPGGALEFPSQGDPVAHPTRQVSRPLEEC